MPLQFGTFRFDPMTLELSEGSTRVALRLQSCQVLKLLVERPGALVTRDEICAAIWRNRVIEFEQGINACIFEIRQALRDDAAAPRYVETLPRRGYRFIEPVRAAARTRRTKTWLAAAGVVGIAAALVAVTMIQRPPPAAPVPTEALEAFQTAAHLAGRDGTESAQVIDYLERAITLAPDYADAWAALAIARIRSDTPFPHAADRARAAIEQALSIDPGHAAATAALAEIEFMYDWDWVAAEASYRLAVRLDPDRHETRLGFAALLFVLGRREEAFRQLEEARRIDPLSTTLYADLGWYLLVDGRPEEALAQCRRLAGIDDEMGIDCAYRIHLEQGNHAAAVTIATGIMRRFGAGDHWQRRLEREEPIRVYNEWRLRWHEEHNRAGGRVSHLRMAQILADLGRGDAALEQLAAAVEARERMLPFLPLFPEFRGLAADEAFRELVAEIGLLTTRPPAAAPQSGRPVSGSPPTARRRQD